MPLKAVNIIIIKMFPHPVYVIQRVGKRNDLSEQALQEQAMTNNRIRRCGPKLNIVNKYFEDRFGPKLNFKDLKYIADQVVKRIPLHVDRISKRNKTAMQCWFTEQWNLIKPILDNMVITISEPQQVAQNQISQIKQNEEKEEIITQILPFEVLTKSNKTFSNFQTNLI